MKIDKTERNIKMKFDKTKRNTHLLLSIVKSTHDPLFVRGGRVRNGVSQIVVQSCPLLGLYIKEQEYFD